MHDGVTIIRDTMIIALMTNLRVNSEVLRISLDIRFTYFILLTELSLYVLSKNGDVLIPIRPHLCVHDAKQMEHFMQEAPPILSPALPLVCQLVGTVEDNLLVPWRLCIHCCTESWFALLDTRNPTMNLDLKVMT